LQNVYWNESGDLVVALQENELIHVTPDGKFRLSSGGQHNVMTLSCMNAALEPFRIEITPEQGDPNAETWGVSDNKSWSVKLVDGMTLPPFGNSNPAIRAGRATLLLKNKEIQVTKRVLIPTHHPLLKGLCLLGHGHGGGCGSERALSNANGIYLFDSLPFLAG
jgi:hypothetical protein